MFRSAVFRLLPVSLLLAACSDSPTSTDTRQPPAAIVTTDSVAAPAPVAPPAPPRPAPAPDTTYVHNVAAFLAGTAPSQNSPLHALTDAPAYQDFVNKQNQSWAKYTSTHTSRMTQWAATELDSVQRQSPTVFYPFSGPDFLNVVTIFPRSDTYVLIGLEPVGSVPERRSLENPRLFPAIQSALWSVLNFSFFRTNDMAVDLKSVELDGAVPLIMLFAVRTGHQVLAVRPVRLDASGQLQPADTTQALGSKAVAGAEIKLRAPDGHPQTVYYFSADLNDWKLNAKSAPLAFVRSLGPLTTYVKSATYLMHKPYFSKVRDLVLARSNYLLQDDSGIAMKYFPADEWDFTYYGTYKRPINLFAKHYQPELTTAYQDSLRRPRLLPFGTGYNWRQTDSNLLLARRRTPVAD